MRKKRIQMKQSLSCDTDLLSILKNEYKTGMRIRLLHMDDPQSPPQGTEGTVIDVDDIGSIMMKWDNGCTLNLIPNKDAYEIVKVVEEYK